MATRPTFHRARVSGRIARIADVVSDTSSASYSAAALNAASAEVGSILSEAGPDVHISDDDAALLRQVIDLVEKTIYSSMDASHDADAAALEAAVGVAVACNVDIAQRQSPKGDLGVLHQHGQDKQTELDRLQGVVDEKTEANNTKWAELESHMQIMSEPPACPDFPARNMPALDVYFEKSEYVIWFTAQLSSYNKVRDAFKAADSALIDAILAYNLQMAVRDVQYCDWKNELEAACAAFDKFFRDASNYYTKKLVPRVTSEMNSRIEVKKSGDTLVHQIRYLLSEVDSQETPDIDTGRYQLIFPDLPAKGSCDLSPLDADEWVPKPLCDTVPTTTEAEGFGSDFPAGLLQCNAGLAAEKTSCSADLSRLNTAIRAGVLGHFNSLSATCDESSCPRGDLAGCLVRLVGHDVMDFNSVLNTGGADGCIDFADPDNLGLQGCLLSAVHERDSSNVSLESMWQDYCTQVSAADFFVITAEALIEATVPMRHRAKWSGSLHDNFRFGRRTQASCSPEPLPNPTDSCDAVQETFVDRMQLTWTQATALMGVHTLGRALPENSGYDGFWVSGRGAMSFDTTYYSRLIAAGWMIETTSAGKHQWGRADGKLLGEMMLNTDVCLAYQTGAVAPFTRSEDANHTGCCLWLEDRHPHMEGVSCNCQGRDLSEGCTLPNCCTLVPAECEGNNPFRLFIRNNNPNHAASFAAVGTYAKSDTGMDSWHDDFMPTWQKVTTQGHEEDLC